jgi:HD-GYP domain-containing protein (c-di-GMP phosphodiesterase class II)
VSEVREATPDGAQPLLAALYAALHGVRLHPIETLAVREALDALDQRVHALTRCEGALELRVVRRALYLNGRRIEHTIENYTYYAHSLDTLERAGVGLLSVVEPPTPRDWQLFLTLLVRAAPEGSPDRIELLRTQMAARSVHGIHVAASPAGTFDLPGESARRQAAKRTYVRSVEVSRDLFEGARLGRTASATEVRHAVQDIVDAVLRDETSLGGLSTLRDRDDYSFTHSVNVCIFCVAIGRRLGLTKAQLYDLGLAALVHDIGMGRIPREILTEQSALSPAERDLMESHTWLGALSVYQLRDYGDVPFRSMLVAYEHHRTADGRGYPRFARVAVPSVFSRIVAVASAFDAATNDRGYHPASPPDAVLRELWENKSLGYDPVIVKALINLLGIYPVGTCVILDTYELAIVHAANSDSAYIHRPIVRLLCDGDGTWLSPPPLIDLAATNDQGAFSRSIIKVTSPEKYGIRVSDYFV